MHFFVWTFKKSDDAAYDYVLNDVKNFIQKIESMAKNINLSLFEDFLNHHHHLIMQNSLSVLRIQMKANWNWNEIVAKIKDMSKKVKE